MSGGETLFGALGTVLTLQRWNVLPRIETWVEAENAVYVSHVAYALGKEKGMDHAELACMMQRNLLKSLSKHFTTDIPVPIRELIQAKNSAVWDQLQDANADKTAALFPRELSRKVRSYLGSEPTYGVGTQTVKRVIDARAEIERIIEYAHNRVAKEECQINASVFISEYEGILNDITVRAESVADHEKLCATYEQATKYFVGVKRLKYLRRWNRINRVVPTSVLAHTYLVSLLAIVICWMEERAIQAVGDLTDFQYEAVLRALFHDVPESLTGDVISPVKDQISRIDARMWDSVEKNYMDGFKKLAPDSVRADLGRLGLLEELDASNPFTVDALVKDCDRLALLLECAYERHAGRLNAEMLGAAEMLGPELQRSEWASVRDMAAAIVLDLGS